jgi:Leucine-rich repeat (LRR) protein
MDAFFAQVQEGFEQLGRDISQAVDKLGSDYNRANGALKRAETARKTGIVSERNAGLSAFPEYIGELGVDAKVVDVSGNRITTIPENIRTLSRVHKLNASRNSISAVHVSLFLGLGNLRVLRLEKNELSCLPPNLGDLAKLEELYLSDNAISRVPASVSSLKRLRRLHFARNALGFRDGTSIRPEAQTREDGLVKTETETETENDSRSDSSLRFLGLCSDLRELILDGNDGIEALPTDFGALKKLQTLSCDATSLRTIPSEVFVGCAALTKLSVKKCDAVEAGELRSVPGFAEFDARRVRSRDKRIAGNVLLDGMDDITGGNSLEK